MEENPAIVVVCVPLGIVYGPLAKGALERLPIGADGLEVGVGLTLVVDEAI